jgi:transglutaminase-like putative cysteine protease
MVRLKFSIELLYDIADPTCDLIFNIHAARTRYQTVIAEQLALSQPVQPLLYDDAHDGTRHMRLQAHQGQLKLRYDATVDIKHHVESPQRLAEMPIAALPQQALPYIYPSRYCQSDRLRKLAAREFGQMMPGYERVRAVQQWVHQRVDFVSGSSNDSTSALDTLVAGTGVCRDFAHLMIGLCRALNLPARFVSGIDYGADPAMGPTDFHAYVEVMLSGRWYLFDPSEVSPPMGLVRIGTGRDAADAAFATVFGAVRTYAPLIVIEAIEDPQQGWTLPHLCADGLSSAHHTTPS